MYIYKIQFSDLDQISDSRGERIRALYFSHGLQPALIVMWDLTRSRSFASCATDHFHLWNY